ncbi:MAG: DUF4159 domain-containing protein [Planctomycetes bacterium]|nr:DUF4159 domain-containing protein [Planctomycetota bacterium]
MNAFRKLSVVSAFSVVMLFTANGIAPEAEAGCTCAGGELEIAFLLDCSGSMNHTLATLQEQVKRIVEALEGQVQSLRVAVIVYRTLEYRGKQPKLGMQPFTADKGAVEAYLRGQSAEGGGQELIHRALGKAIDELEWTKGARKVAVLLGDEQPAADKQAECLALAAELRKRGIALNTVTASRTAWIYWGPANVDAWKAQVDKLGDEEAKRVFRLPYFDDLAAKGGGVSVSSWNSKELILWLLAFGLGLNEADAKSKIDLDRYLAWVKERKEEEAKEEEARAAAAQQAQGTPLIAWLKHSGEWQVPHRFDGLFAHLGKHLNLAGPPRVATKGLLDEDLERYPILYLTGHGAFEWPALERSKLKAHLEGGGFLIIDACCGDEAFAQSARKLFEQLFPDRPLDVIPKDDPLYACGHRLATVRRSEKPRSAELKESAPELFGLRLPDPLSAAPRLAAVFSPSDLGCAWHARPLGVPCMFHDDDGLSLSANIFLYALTR